MKPQTKHFSRLLFATFSAMLMLPACVPVIDTDMRDLKNWQASARKPGRPVQANTHAQVSANADKNPGRIADRKADKIDPSQAQANPHTNPSGNHIDNRIITSRDPFAPFVPKIAATPSGMTNSQDATTPAAAPEILHLLGTVHDGGKLYALIEADRQVHCVALNASLPSYPITVFRIAHHSVELDRRLPDGSHLRSTLRQGK
jgi:Tfp pilus assembly protein PilP